MLQRLRSAAKYLIRPQRIVLLILLAASVGVGSYVYRVQRQRQAAAVVRQAGGIVAYDYQLTTDVVYLQAPSWVPISLRSRLGDDYFHSVVYIDVAYVPDDSRPDHDGAQSDEFLSALDELPGLRSVALKHGPKSEERLQEIGRLKQLQHLVINHPRRLTDRGVAHFQGLQRLETLSVRGGDLTDESLRLLAALPCMENLDVRGQQFTDQGLAYAGKMEALKVLWVGTPQRNPAITDEGLRHLAGLPQLEGLDLEGTGVTEQGLLQLSNSKFKWLRLQNTNVRDSSRLRLSFPQCAIEL